MVVRNVKARFLDASQCVADGIYAKLNGVEWSSPPRYACKRIATQLGIRTATTGELDGVPVVYLSTRNGTKFVGPNVESKWNCSLGQIGLLRRSMSRGCVYSIEPMSENASSPDLHAGADVNYPWVKVTYER